jgi:hypothetical protein
MLLSRKASGWDRIGRRRATRCAFLCFGANGTIRKANEHADYHQEKIDLHRFIAFAA